MTNERMIVAVPLTMIKSGHLLSTYYRQDTMLSTVHVLINLIFPITLWGRFYYRPLHLKDKDTEAQSCLVMSSDMF